MATTTDTTRSAGTEPCIFASNAFHAVTLSLADIVPHERYLGDMALEDGVDVERVQDETLSAWDRAQAATAAFLRSNHSAPASADLVAVAERIDTVLSLKGIDSRDALFGEVTEVMVMRSRLPIGSPVDDLVAAALPWITRVAIHQAVLLPDDVDDRTPMAA